MKGLRIGDARAPKVKQEIPHGKVVRGNRKDWNHGCLPAA